MKFIRTPSYQDAMPIDISGVFGDEAPAGKHGFLKAVGEDFVFEDGTRAKFWGVNFNGGANFPEHSFAEGVARRLRMTGVNLVRFHQLDADWDTPNIFQFAKGPKLNSTRKLDPVSMERLDYLVYCLKNAGIYIYFDFLTYRRFRTGDGVVDADLLRDAARPYSVFDPHLIELQKEFITQILGHFNPYTNLTYAEDPVFVLAEITNENDVFLTRGAKTNHPYYENELTELYKAWTEEHGITVDWENHDNYGKTPELWQFKTELTMKYYRELRDHIRKEGGKFPVTGTNYTNVNPGNVLTQKEMDFCDNHGYIYEFGRWTDNEHICTIQQVNGQECVLPVRGLMHLNNRPFFYGEWDMPWPNSFRAEGPIYYAMVCALQGWSGMAVHTYAYGTRGNENSLLGKEISSTSIGSVAFREGVFTTWNDPCIYGLFYHCTLMVRREDLKPAKVKVGIHLDAPYTLPNEANGTGLEVHRLRTVPEEEAPEGCDMVINASDKVEREDPDLILSDNGECWRSLSKKIGVIDTERTKVVYGRLNGAKNFGTGNLPEFKDVRIETKQDFGVIAMSSLTDDGIRHSDNILLTAVSRAQNTGSRFDGERMMEIGTAPILSEVITATISIRTDREKLKVWGVGPEGYLTGKMASSYKDGVFTFTIGENYPAMYYLIQEF